MPLHVICPGCLKRFQVNARFAGMKGPCPSCGTIIDIPKEGIKIQNADDTEPGKGTKRKASVQLLPRSERKFDPVVAGWYALGVLGVLLLAFVLGCIPMHDSLRTLIGTLGLCLIAFPLALLGYQAVRDQEQIFTFTHEELYRRAGVAAAGYVILWIVFEYFLAATRADIFVSWFYFAGFAGLATLLAIPIFVMKVRDAFLHYCIFGFSIILCRFLIGLGWFWQSSELIRRTAAPPPPILPGI